jgi:hypothetical protein
MNSIEAVDYALDMLREREREAASTFRRTGNLIDQASLTNCRAAIEGLVTLRKALVGALRSWVEG